MSKPELVLPAGNLEKLKVAFTYGADAVYLGGEAYSLRAYAGNFNLADMAEGINFAKKNNKKVYVAVNIIAHNRDLKDLPAYLEKLQALQVDAIIISDLGILRLANQYAPLISKTISTQANITNYESAAMYKELGATRLVLAREVTWEDMQEIKEKVDIDLEIFVHGAMCVSYSGRCLISHYMTGRSANQGACAHPCRYKYHLVEEKRPNEYYPIEEDDRGSYILNSRDLCLLEYLPKLIDVGIDAFKVEGRMKSPLYIASVATTYRQAIDQYSENRTQYSPEDLDRWLDELSKTATRPFTNGFIAGESRVLQDLNNEKTPGRASFSGVVLTHEDRLVKVEQRSNFGVGDKLEFLLPSGQSRPVNIEKLWDENLQPIERARHPKQIVYFASDFLIPEFTILRKVGERHKR
ncbi:MAG TPA: U32 family peptidase [Syntrophomonadaceae bacterium]|nr:U32 family peptidase [Syntrophomonadaceae bacterium]